MFRFRGIARWLWVALFFLMTGMLVDAWFHPPDEGFLLYARKMLVILIVSFVCAPFFVTGVISLVAWLADKEIDDADKD